VVVGLVTAPLPRCQHCGNTVVDTAVGWTHVDHRGTLLGWLCPEPQMTLAYPTADPAPLPRRGLPPDWVPVAKH
jgi:hypothetical protein